MDEDSTMFKGKMFWVWEGNLKDNAWQCHINQYHGIEID
jgi:hypothetical protein